jgi:hypothetical protein
MSRHRPSVRLRKRFSGRGAVWPGGRLCGNGVAYPIWMGHPLLLFTALCAMSDAVGPDESC